MSPSEKKVALLIYKTFIDHEKSKLMELSRHHHEMSMDLPEALTGDAYGALEDYLTRLREALFTIDLLQKALNEKLKTLE